jgi:hypothetical protein
MLAGSPESQHRSWGHQTYLTGLTTVEDDTPSFGPGAPVSTHPLIVKNPTTGRRSIFITPFITTKITGIPAEESDGHHRLSCKALCPPGLPMPTGWRATSSAAYRLALGNRRPCLDAAALHLEVGERLLRPAGAP